ncbi:hypothetical protein [Domibacillus iocasae]|uniref:Family 2 glycosyl transferase n=1 Tax=Domibacillus iocasae TaxID=1714016 RepID=A0A1E7DUH3_9BACI|nr:hypothetical protein [Domibacillus iocasae]OES46704.1 hypothetical protein BA724_01190 [Domibacillus iocasae]
MKVNKKWIVLPGILFLLLLPRLIWELSETKEEKVVILDKTVPTDDKREHRALSWVLKHLHFSTFGGEDDYYGYFPEKKTKEKALPESLKDADVIYAVDTYGVYDEENNLVYGGLEMSEWEAIKQQTADHPTTLIMEFNTFASPTKQDVKNDMASFLHTKPTGWTGRAFQDLSKDNNELTEGIISLYEADGEKWTFKGSGFVLVNEEQEKVIVLSDESGDLNSTKLTMDFTPEGKRITGLNKAAPYTYWFDITVPENTNDILANYQWDLSQKGKAAVEREGIPLSFPAVIHHAYEQSDLFYFAGDFADTAEVSSVYKYAGFASMRALITPSTLYPEQAFFWKTYVPLMKGVLSMEKKAEKEAAAVPVEEKNGLFYTARLNGDRFDVLEDGKWKTITAKGVNIGMGKPGAFPGEAAISESEYYDWLTQIGEMNANMIRVYTIHPPGFYNALKRYNEEHDKPIYVLHGVWVDEGPLEETLDAFTPEITNEFQSEMKRVADVIHGNADIEQRTGHASGVYRADISPYVIGWVLGIEWYPYMVDNMKTKHAGLAQYEGAFVRTEQAEPMEIWLAEQMDTMMKYEADTYNWTRPMSFTNWVTTDLLDHPAEPQKQEDLVSVNPNTIRPKKDTQMFASYHVYPYYPDFLNLDDKYLTYKDSRGENNSYAGYLHDLRAAHDMPVLIAEFGIPASRGMTHRNAFGLNQGFMSEKQQGEGLIHLYDDILAEKMMGGLVFTWQDEWFKRTWNTMDLDDPERRPYWSNAQTNEQQFGLLSFDRLLVKTDENMKDWKGIKPFQGKEDHLYVTHDERYLYIRSKTVDGKMPTIYFDVHPTIGSEKFGGVSFELNNPEFELSFDNEKKGNLRIDAYYDTFLYQYGFDVPMLKPTPQKPVNNSGVLNPIRLALNKEIVRPDTGKVLPFDYYETGVMRFGNSNPESADYDSLADYYVNKESGDVELRIPWLLLNMKDPSSHKAMGDIFKEGIAAEETIEGIGIAVSFAEESTDAIPKMNMYEWESWNEGNLSEERLKQSYYLLQNRFEKEDQ